MTSVKFSTAILLSLSFYFGAHASPACEQRKAQQISLEQHQALIGFFNQLSFLDRYRSGPDARGVTYAQKLTEIVSRNQALLGSGRAQEIGVEYLFIEELRQSIFATIGMDDPAWKQYDHVTRSMLFFSSLAPRPLKKAAAVLQKRILDWTYAGSTDAIRLQRIAKAEPTTHLLNTVTQNTLRYAEENWHLVRDHLEGYRQVLVGGLGVTAFFGTLASSGAIVAAASASLRVAGLTLAGCGIGSSGAGFASIIEHQYNAYSSAYIESLNKGTSYTCELRQQIEHRPETYLSEVAGSMAKGAMAGCGFTTASLIAPQLTTWTVVNAVGVAAVAQGTFAANDLYLARKSYLIYLSLKSYEQAESAASAGNREKAEFYLRQSQSLAQKAGAQALEAILIGSVIPAFVSGEISHAIGGGREALVSLIGKSSDNAAIAAQMLAKYAFSDSSAH